MQNVLEVQCNGAYSNDLPSDSMQKGRAQSGTNTTNDLIHRRGHTLLTCRKLRGTDTA